MAFLQIVLLSQNMACPLSSLPGNFITSYPASPKTLFTNSLLTGVSASLCHLVPKPRSCVLTPSLQEWTLLDSLLPVQHHSELPVPEMWRRCGELHFPESPSLRSLALLFEDRRFHQVWGAEEEENWWLWMWLRQTRGQTLAGASVSSWK